MQNNQVKNSLLKDFVIRLTFIANLNLGSFKSNCTVCKSSRCLVCFNFPFIVSKSVTKCEKSEKNKKDI